VLGEAGVDLSAASASASPPPGRSSCSPRS
jgi:hypothetical protein